MTGFYEESEEIYQIEERKEDDLESDKSETDERDQIENPELLDIYYGFNKWHSNYKILAKFGKYYE